MDEEKTTPEAKEQPAPEKAEPAASAAPAPEKPEAPKPSAESAQQPPETSGTDELTSLKAQLARAQTERIAALEAVKLGIDPKHIDYVLKLAELPEGGKPADIQKALQKVLDDIPAFKASAAENRPALRIGADDPKQVSDEDKIAAAFGNTKKN